MRNLSFFEALLHMFKGSIGPGVLSLPYALSQSGICFLPVVLCLQAACAYCMLLMVKMKQDLESRPATAHVSSYGDVAAVALGGGLGRGVVDLFVVLQQLGICTVYFSFFATNVATLLADFGVGAFGGGDDAGGPAQAPPLLVLVALPALALLAQIRRWKTLAPFSLVANVLIIAGVGIVFGIVLEQLFRAGAHSPLPLVESAWPGLPVLFGQVLYAYECVCQVLPLESELVDSSRMYSVLNVSNVAYGIVMLAMAALPVLAFGAIEGGSVGAELQQLLPKSAAVIILNIAITLSVVLTFPVQFYPAIEVIETRLGLRDDAPPLRASLLQAQGPSCASALEPPAATEAPKLPPPPGRAVAAKRAQLRLAAVGATAALAASVPHLGLVISLCGSFNAPMLAVILPPLLANRTLECGRGRRALHLAIAAAGAVGSAAGTAASIVRIAEMMA